MNQELERFEPGEAQGRIAYEHLHRYAMCRDRVAGQRVLDVACGAGYGTNILAQVAAEATGIDIDPGTIQRATKKYKRGNLKFVTASCYEMPFDASSFDVVVANEMIEHIDDQDAFLEEAKRVLKPGGVLLVSTPNKPIYNRYKSPNPFHLAELTIPEFRNLLRGHFGHVSFTGLRMALVSAGFDLDGAKSNTNLAAAKTYRGARLRNNRLEVSNDELNFEDPEYVLAACSDYPIEDAPIHSTIFFSNDDDLWIEHEKIMAWASQLHEEDEVLRANLVDTRTELDRAQSALDDEKRTNNRSTDEARQHLTVSSRLLTRLTGSEVGADPVSLVDAMFALNEQLVVQRSRLETLGSERERLSRELDSERVAQENRLLDFRRELGETNDRHARELGSSLAIQQSQAEELEKSHAAQRAQLAELEQARAAQLAHLGELEQLRSAQMAQLEELNRSRATEEELRELVRHSELRMEELQRHSRERNEERDKVARAAEMRAAGLERQLKAAHAEIANSRSAGPAEYPMESASAEIPRDSAVHTGNVQPGMSSHQSRRRARFEASHRQIQEELTHARSEMHGAINAFVPARRSFVARLKRKRTRDIPFDRDWIELQGHDGKNVNVAAFFKDPQFHGVDPHPLFSAAFYLEQNPDVAEAGISPYQHYLEHGWREGRDPHPYFSNDWYLRQNQDVRDAETNPLVHYLQYGWSEGRRPNPVFDPVEYLSKFPDVREGGIEPLTHYVKYGEDENREVPFLGLERDWRTLVSDPDSKSLMDQLLSGTVALAEPPLISESDRVWPPQPLNDFWIPQVLRDFLIERRWETRIPLYTYLYSVMDAYTESPQAFPDSVACRQLIDRAKQLSTAVAPPGAGGPEASIIIPVYNNLLDTLLCIVSILETMPTTDFEIIVADDCSTDRTQDRVPEIGGIVRYVRHSENQGFLSNCNAAAAHASGRKIILLNNDVLVLPGWLENLIAPFEAFDRVGLVGSKLIGWDGRLQEAGGILWRDGSAWNFGRGQHATDSEYNYVKDVDYCSGASIALPSALWRELSGFDPDFCPAYCEDSDLAFRIRAAGYRTLYSPHSELIHHEGRSHGRDTGTGIKAYQVANQQRLFDRWHQTLERENFPNGENLLRARDRSAERPHILVIDHYVPQVDKDAGSRTMFQFIEALVDDGWSVTFWPENLHHDKDHVPSLENLGVEVIYGPRFVGKFSDFLRNRAGLYDAVLLSRPHVAVHFIDDVRTLTDARVLYYGHDVHFERMKAQREIASSSLKEDQIEAMRALELGICDRSDVVLYPSEEEAQLIGKLVPQEVQCRAIPAYRFADSAILEGGEAAARIASPVAEPVRLLFVGGFAHGPNVDGISWFCRDVAPILRRDGFQFELQIAGSNPSGDVWELDGDDTHVLGFVSDEKLAELYRNASIVIAPLRYGAGVKGKVVEAMSRGVPIVTTGVGAQGLFESGSYLFVANTPEEFAAALRAAADPELAKEKAARALDYVRKHYSREAMIEVFRQVLPAVVANRKLA